MHHACERAARQRNELTPVIAAEQVQQPGIGVFDLIAIVSGIAEHAPGEAVEELLGDRGILGAFGVGLDAHRCLGRPNGIARRFPCMEEAAKDVHWLSFSRLDTPGQPIFRGRPS